MDGYFIFFNLRHFHTGKTITPNCTAAGLHFNPYNVNHGAPDATERHVGDMGNFKSDKDGQVRTQFRDKLVSLYGKNNVFGRALVIHQLRDDLGLTDHPNSKTSGNSGSRISCGIVSKW
jgi:Cu-Zn family superoxide dismutase